MQIILNSTFNTCFASVNSWEQANTAARAIWKRNKYSDIAYKITFDDGETASGTIDIEPKSHFAPVNRNILTWHLKTFWTNISKADRTRYPYVSEEEQEYFKKMLNYLPTNNPIH